MKGLGNSYGDLQRMQSSFIRRGILANLPRMLRLCDKQIGLALTQRYRCHIGARSASTGLSTALGTCSSSPALRCAYVRYSDFDVSR